MGLGLFSVQLNRGWLRTLVIVTREPSLSSITINFTPLVITVLILVFIYVLYGCVWGHVFLAHLRLSKYLN